MNLGLFCAVKVQFLVVPDVFEAVKFLYPLTYLMLSELSRSSTLLYLSDFFGAIVPVPCCTWGFRSCQGSVPWYTWCYRSCQGSVPWCTWCYRSCQGQVLWPPRPCRSLATSSTPATSAATWIDWATHRYVTNAVILPIWFSKTKHSYIL